MLFDFLSGAITMGFLVAGFFFLRFWKRTRDSLFLAFAAAFWLLGLAQALLALHRHSGRGAKLALPAAPRRLLADPGLDLAEEPAGVTERISLASARRHRARRAGLRARPAAAVAPAPPAPHRRAPRPPPDRQRQRAGPRPLSAGFLAARRLRPRPARPRRLGPEAASGGCSNIGRTKPRCCRSSSTRCCAGGWRGPSAARAAGGASGPMPASGAREAEAVLARIRARGSAGRVGLRGGQGPQRLVGMERHQARARMAVLGRPHHHRDPARQLRAGLRPHRAGDPRRDPGAADAGRGGRAAALVALPAGRSASPPTADLRDYFRLAPEPARPRSPSWSRRASWSPVAVEGWRQAAFLHRDARRPRRIAGQALLAPFDPLIWERARAERLFGFRYRIEIYTPADKRVHGYYVLPFLMDERAGRPGRPQGRPAGRRGCWCGRRRSSPALRPRPASGSRRSSI